MIRPFYLVCCIFASCLVAEQPPKYALLGQTVILDPFGTTISPEDILWKHNGDKVVEFNSNEERVYGSFEHRITLDWISAELTISDLRHEDSGVYALEAYTKKELKRASFTLEVIDRVAKPTVSCDMNNGNSSIKSGNHATLRCSAEARLSPSLMKFEWNSHGKTQLGENLIIPLGDGHDDEVYDCTVSNPLTKESTTFTAKECYPDGGSAGLAAGICVAIIAGILIILAVVFCKLKQKACFAKENSDVEKLPKNLPKTKGSKDKAAQDEEHIGLLPPGSEALNAQNVCKKGLVNKHIKIFGDKAPGLEKNKPKRTASRPPLDSAHNKKEDPDVHLVKEVPEEERDPSGSKKSNNVSGDESENKPSDLQPTIASEQPGAEEKGDEETKSSSAVGVHLPAAEPHLLATDNSQNQSPQDGSGEHEDQTVSDQQNQDTTGNNEGDSSEGEEGKQPEDLNKKTQGSEEDKRIPAVTSGPQDSAENDKGDTDVGSPKESAENKDSSDSEKSNVVSDTESDQQPSTASEQPVSPLTQDAPNITPQVGAGQQENDSRSDQVTGGTIDLSQGRSDLKSNEENESSNHSDVKDNSTISDQKDPETTDEQNSQQKETRQGEDSQQGKDNSEDNHDSDSANEQEKTDQNKKLPPDPPQKPQRTITSKPDDSNTSTSPVTEHAVPDEKEKDKTRQNRGSDSSMEEAGRGEAAEN